MSFLESVFGWSQSSSSAELPELFPLSVSERDFILTDVVSIYSKILTDVLERTHGLSEEQIPLMWDNCVKSSKADGLITLLSKAMTNKAELYLVYDRALDIIREATSEEQGAIQADYKKSAKSAKGVYITFYNYRRSDMVKLYSALEYCTISALNKTMNVSAAVQLKFSELRSGMSLTDSPKGKEQAQDIASSLLNQRPVMIDAKDSVETATPDLTATQASIALVAQKLSFYLGMPASYLTGVQTGGIGSTGEADTKAVERGLKNYFYSIMKPTLEAIFGGSVSYKSQDTTNMQSGLEILKTFSLTDEEFLSRENKTKIVNKVFDLPEDAEGDEVPKENPNVPAPGRPVQSVPPRSGSNP